MRGGVKSIFNAHECSCNDGVASQRGSNFGPQRMRHCNVRCGDETVDAGHALPRCEQIDAEIIFNGLYRFVQTHPGIVVLAAFVPARLWVVEKNHRRLYPWLTGL